MEKYLKLRNAMRSRLQGAAAVDRRYLVALEAFNFSEELFEGKFRKDGTTPVFMHPLEIAGYLFTVHGTLRHPAESIAVAMVHDAVEDCGVSVEQVRDLFGPLVAHGTMRMSKEINGVSVGTLEHYFRSMLDCPVATVVKGSDRINNQSTMVGVFTPKKQMEYVRECEEHILPMLKSARRKFPDQEPAYENMKLVLTTQIAMVRAIHAGKQENA